MMALPLLLGCLLDQFFGEPKRWHPLVGFGTLASLLEKQLNILTDCTVKRFLLGAFCYFLLAIVPTIFLFLWLSVFLSNINVIAFMLVNAYGVYWAVGWCSLNKHAEPIVAALKAGDMQKARESVGNIVSRNCIHASNVEIRRATIESLLENTSDAVVAPLFWYAVAGLPGIVFYRLSNTLDAMWGYKNERYLYFGRTAARFDDVLNIIPARLTALSFAIFGHSVKALTCWHYQAKYYASPNAGPVITAGAGALDVKLGGPAIYHGQRIDKPFVGSKRNPTNIDVHQAILLMNKTILLCLCLFIAVLSL